jgi:hypothetical protein
LAACLSAASSTEATARQADRSSPGRSELYKLTRPEFLTRFRTDYRLLQPEGVDRIDQDHFRD